MYAIYDADEWETVHVSRPCSSCGGDLRKCDGRCNGMVGLGQRRRPHDEVKRIKAERQRLHEQSILAQADAIRARVFPLKPLPPPESEEGEMFTFHIQPMDTIGGRFAQKVTILEGYALVIQGTNDGSLGWVDLHELFKGRVYRDRLIPTARVATRPYYEVLG